MTKTSNSTADISQSDSIFSATPFTLKRRSNPKAAFNEMIDHLLTAVAEDDEMAKAFSSFQRHFKGVMVEREDAVRLADLYKRGAGDLGIKVGLLPPEIGPGLAYMYDAAIETLRSTDHVIKPETVGPRAIRFVERSLKTTLPLVGSMSVVALEQALEDKDYSDRLHQRAVEIGPAFLNQPPGVCEFCELSVTDQFGNITAWCGSKNECDNAGGIFILALLLWGLVELLDWLF
ncbi:hypothetical protein AB0N05_07940 [Nocardia sp. NPDC051030]|uniref:hypothetical protein n=1 Tax=Nocardia sp. NPDC051030 TaxID=3155162 RepID=UPI003437E1BA